MTDIHSCSYHCDRPECIKAQRDELRERLAQPGQEQKPVPWESFFKRYCPWLAQPEQEPVAWLDGPHLVVRLDMRNRLNYQGPWVDLGRAIPDKWTPFLFTTPPQRKPLSDEEIDALPLPPSGTATVRDLVRIIEAAHDIKES